jgi:Mg-chelatase subunit ChlD
MFLVSVCAALRSESIASLVIDTQTRFTSTGRSKELAELLGGQYVYLPHPDAHTVYQSVMAAAKATRQKEKR